MGTGKSPGLPQFARTVSLRAARLPRPHTGNRNAADLPMNQATYNYYNG